MRAPTSPTTTPKKSASSDQGDSNLPRIISTSNPSDEERTIGSITIGSSTVRLIGDNRDGPCCDMFPMMSASDLYPVVQDLSEIEYASTDEEDHNHKNAVEQVGQDVIRKRASSAGCCCFDGNGNLQLGDLTLQDLSFLPTFRPDTNLNCPQLAGGSPCGGEEKKKETSTKAPAPEPDNAEFGGIEIQCKEKSRWDETRAISDQPEQATALATAVRHKRTSSNPRRFHVPALLSRKSSTPPTEDAKEKTEVKVHHTRSNSAKSSSSVTSLEISTNDSPTPASPVRERKFATVTSPPVSPTGAKDILRKTFTFSPGFTKKAPVPKPQLQKSSTSGSTDKTPSRHARVKSDSLLVNPYSYSAYDQSPIESPNRIESSSNRKFDDKYVLTRMIFRCNHSEVWETVHRQSSQRYCVKILFSSKSGGGRDQSSDVARHEVAVLAAAQGHNSIVELKEVVYESDRIYVVMEYLTRGNLLTRVIQNESLPENMVKSLAKSLLEGILYLHTHGLCHNDLQASNILIAPGNKVKIADFGSSHRLRFPTPSTGDSSATLSFLESNSLAQADMWSVGILMYFMLFGQSPHNDLSPLSSRTRSLGSSNLTSSGGSKRELLFPTTSTKVSRLAKQLISGLIHVDPSIRFTAAEALAHPWFQDAPTSTVSSSHKATSSGMFAKSREVESSSATVNKKKNGLTNLLLRGRRGATRSSPIVGGAGGLARKTTRDSADLTESSVESASSPGEENLRVTLNRPKLVGSQPKGSQQRSRGRGF